MKTKILLSAFACDPKEGSEKGNGWNWATGLSAKGYEVHCLTRDIAREQISSMQQSDNIHFYFLKLPFGLESLYNKSQGAMYLYYLLWQYSAYIKAKKLNKKHSFSLAHHVTWGSIQLGSFLYKLRIPFIFGPAGGGQSAPVAFKKYFANSWAAEEKRNKVSAILLKFNPAAKKMYASAQTIWVSNPDTEKLVKTSGAKNVIMSLDAALPKSFFPESFQPKQRHSGSEPLKLLWVGRFMPRKGIILVMDVMRSLKGYPHITLTVVGDGEQKELFLEKVKEYDLKDTVNWKGKVSYEEVRSFYANHDAFIFTSLRDSCPAQLIEAMAFGLPIITLNLHGQSVIVSENTGFRCSCESPELAINEIKDSILKLLNGGNLLTQMSEAAHNFSLKQTWDNKLNTVIEKSYPVSDI